MQVTVLASFLDNSSVHCTCTHTFKLPLALFAQMVPPLKSNTEKLTVMLNQAPAAVLDLFDDVAQSSSPEATAVRPPTTPLVFCSTGDFGHMPRGANDALRHGIL